ncbi:hypothetical protein [Streptomyces sp. NPDC127100]|uniref:hypothetical protein n=1 Tax=Streptomyces sp. NPDC127100 TaxID=3347138 RepID=UPI00364EB13F
MTPWLRAARATGLAGIVGAGVLLSPCAAGAAQGTALVTPGALRGPSSPVAAPAPAHGAGSGPDAPADPGRPGRPEHLERPAGSGRSDVPHHPDDRPGTRPSSAHSPTAPSHTSRAEEGRPTSRPTSGAGRGSATPSRAPSKPSPSASVPGGEPSRAGSGAGEGRQRPGRPETRDDGVRGEAVQEGVGSRVADLPDAPAAAVPPGRDALTPTATPPRSEPTSGTRTEGAAGPVLKVLPLGTGLVLVGLGLALAFLGLRVRRGGV